MQILFSSDRVEGMALPDLIQRTAALCCQRSDMGAAHIGKQHGRRVRFRLLDTDGAMASEQFHDRFIAAIYDLDPLAKVDTARAKYDCRDDFRRQLRASLAPE